jgi:hypothetical protein
MLHRRILIYSDARVSDATLQIRLEHPLRQRGFEVLHAQQFLQPGKTAADNLDWTFDAIVVHRSIKRRCTIYPLLLSAARQHRIPLVHDTDDLLLSVHPQHPDYEVYHSRVLYVLKALMDADFIVASTQPLAEQLGAVHGPVAVVPNELPPELWQGVCQQRLRTAAGHGDGRVTVGYIGSGTHRPDLQSVEDALVAVLDRHAGRVRFLSVGVPLTPRLKRHAWVEELDLFKRRMRPYAEFAQLAATLPIDVGIAPLVDAPFNHCKSDMKFQEYAALGIAGVYADLPPYRGRVRHGENGLLAADTNQWVEGLERLIGSAVLRRTMARAAADDILTGWRGAESGKRPGELWEQILEQVSAEVRSGAPAARNSLAPVVDELLQYQSGLERIVKRTVGYQIGKAFKRLVRKLAA